MVADSAGSTPVEQLLAGARLWGAELDTRYRVLAITVELASEQHPVGDATDRRVQLLASPVSRFAGVLRRNLEDGRQSIEQFDVDQLTDVVAAGFGGVSPTVTVDGGELPLDRRFPQLSLEGSSQAPDGRAHTLHMAATADDDRAHLDLQVSFDDLEVRDPDGHDLTPR